MLPGHRSSPYGHKVGRNGPCPCGCGPEYKRPCGALNRCWRHAIATVDATVDDFGAKTSRARNGGRWELVSDRVMGGISQGSMQCEIVDGRRALRMQGHVSLENHGGFLQLALDLAADGQTVDARGYTGIEIEALGNGERYNLHLRTADVSRPWQSYRHTFVATPHWGTHRLPFSAFEPHRIDTPLALEVLRRIGIVAIGRAFDVDVAISAVRFYV